MNKVVDIKANEVKQMMDANDDIIIIDVRDEEEYANKHIATSINIPLTMINELVPFQFYDRDAIIIVYCETGNRSSDAARLLVELGYTNVFDLGSIDNWPYETSYGLG
jgi:rhodanese-related sulfurtransferase